MSLVRDLSVSAVAAGFVTVLVGFASSAVIVFQAAGAAGATEAQVASWMLALGLGMGLTCILLSWHYRVPVVTAWSTPGAVLLVTSAAGLTIEEATGAVFTAMSTQFALGFGMFGAYLVARRLAPRYAVIAALAVGMALALSQGLLHADTARLALATPVWVTPRLSPGALIGVALPLFVVTMASQNVPGVAVIRASGYAVPLSPLIGWTGLANLALAPFGGFALNRAARHHRGHLHGPGGARGSAPPVRGRHGRRPLLHGHRTVRGHGGGALRRVSPGAGGGDRRARPLCHHRQRARGRARRPESAGAGARHVPGDRVRRDAGGGRVGVLGTGGGSHDPGGMAGGGPSRLSATRRSA
jgi:hypothetical protein